MGEKIRMKCNVGDSSLEYEWYSGQIIHFDPTTRKYGVFFPSDKQTSYIDPVKEAGDIVWSDYIKFISSKSNPTTGLILIIILLLYQYILCIAFCITQPSQS